MQDIACEDQYIAQETTVSEQGPSVTVSVRGEPHNMTVYEVSRLSAAEFAALWTVSSFGTQSLFCTQHALQLRCDHFWQISHKMPSMQCVGVNASTPIVNTLCSHFVTRSTHLA